MRRVLRPGLVLALGLAAACSWERRPLEVTFYPSYGYLDEAGDEWTIPLRIWVHSPHAKTAGLLESVAAEFATGADAAAQRERFRARVADLVADSRSERAVRFVFDRDPRGEEFRLASARGAAPATDLNGLVEGTIRLSRARAEELLRAQGADAWLTLAATSTGEAGRGRVRLIAPEGRSVVSDIDDTIKVTEIPAGPRIVFRNTFFREFVAAPGMVERYRALAAEGCVFHFVSGGPWQMYAPLAAFLGDSQYPEGTFHMKSVPKNLLAAASWEGLHKLAQGDATFAQKVAQISELVERFPRRRFVLIGDSGERDPEVFRALRERFGERVEKIYIRHVLPDPPGERLAGMEVIAAAPVLAGVSGLPD